jgi:hypothetical protein
MGILSILGLMEETKNTVLSRGHNVKKWLVLGNDCYAMECADSKKSVMIKEHPLPNEIKVGGEAVAVNCVKPVKEKKLRKK